MICREAYREKLNNDGTETQNSSRIGVGDIDRRTLCIIVFHGEGE